MITNLKLLIEKMAVLSLAAILLTGCAMTGGRTTPGTVKLPADSEPLSGSQMASVPETIPDSALDSSEEVAHIKLHTNEGDMASTPQTADSSAGLQSQGTDCSSEIDALLRQMTLRQKVGQLFIVRPDALEDAALSLSQAPAPGTADSQEPVPGAAASPVSPREPAPAANSTAQPAPVTALSQSMASALKAYPVGGIAIFSQNIVSPEQLAAFNNDLQDASDLPLFLSVDEEGGLVARLANHPAFDLPKYKNAAAVGSTGDPAAARAMGSTIGEYLSQYGFNMDFAPDADVNTNPDNPVIGTRAFSSDAATAAQMAKAMAEGLKSQNIIPVFKHFPGHGDTAEDSHNGLAVSYKTLKELESCEFLPFQEAGSQDCIMAGHIAVPAVEDSLTPATMSYEIVTGILKDQWNFDGLIITDSLEMKAITDAYTPGEAALGALQAGCDLLLMPADLPEAFEAVVAAVEDGTLPEAQLEEHVRRILKLKLEYGLLAETQR